MPNSANIDTLKFLESFKRSVTLDRPTLINVAYTSLATKINNALAKKLAADVVDAVLTIRPPPPPKGSRFSSVVVFTS